MNKTVCATLGLLFLFLTVPSIAYATLYTEKQVTVNEGQSGLLRITVKAPSEVKPEEEFLINFTLTALNDSGVSIGYIRVEFGAMGSYRMEWLVKADENLFIGRGGTVKRNMTFVVKPTGSYPNLVRCDLWLECGIHGEYQFFHYRFVISYCTPSTYQELMETIESQENNLSSWQSTAQRFQTTTTILGITTGAFALTTSILAVICFRKRKTKI